MSTSTQARENQRKKSQKTSRVQLDYISNLPNGLISDILCRLPMKDAVRTSILAKDWKFKWTSMYKIVLDDNKPYKSKSNKKTPFVNFVKRTLLLLHYFRSFHLSCAKKYKSSDIETWISTALTRDLHCLEIYHREAGIILSPNLIKCKSLRKLELNIPCSFNVSSKIRFLHLTALRLNQVEIRNELPNSDPLRFDFPVLEKIELIECKWLNVKCVEIYAPKRAAFEYVAPRGLGEHEYLIKITQDGLVKLQPCDSLPGDMFLSGGVEVVQAVLRIHGIADHDDLLIEKAGLQMRKQLKELLSLRYLHLWSSSAKAIARSNLGLSLPVYRKMERLYMKGPGNSETLLELLHAAPFLKRLDICVMDWNDNDFDYDTEQNVPSCIISQLEDVKFRFFVGTAVQFQLARFFLKNALNLKNSCFVAHYHHMSRNEIKKELSRYPKASACLSISITSRCVAYD